MFLAPFALALLAPSNVWTVDDDGPADFATVIAAVAAAAAGDVISIAPGSYPGTVVVDKPLTLVGFGGDARPVLTAVEARGLAWINLRHLELTVLELESIPGASRIEDCVVHFDALPPGFDYPPNFAVQAIDCQQLFVQGCTFSAYYDDGGFGRGALGISSASRVHVSGSELRGSDSTYTFVYPDAPAGNGGTGLNVRGGSHVTVVASSLYAGGGMDAPPALFPTLPPQYGVGGTALWASDPGTRVDVRGSVQHVLVAGVQDFTVPGSPVNGWALRALGGPVAEVSGVSVFGPHNATLVPARPFLTLDGQGSPGSTSASESFGTPGAVGVHAASVGTLSIDIPAWGPAQLWLDPSRLVDLRVLSLAGPATGVAVTYSLPNDPALVGAALQLQALELGPLGTFTLTNATSLLIGS